MSLPLVLLNFVAWSGLVWLGIALITCIGASPRMTRNLWRVGAALMFLPLAVFPFVTAPVKSSEGILPDFVMDGAVVTLGASEVALDVQEIAVNLPALDTLLWGGLIAGWVFRFGLSVFRQIRLQVIKRNARVLEMPTARWVEALGLSDEPAVCEIESGSPFVAGVRRAAIYLPKSVVRLEGVDHVIAHECVHLKQGDMVTRPIERLMADVFWFSPFAWLVRGQLDYWREAVVDEETSQLTGDRVGYARTLAAVARHARPVKNLPVAAFILPKEGNLKMRIKSVLENSPRRPVATLAAIGFLTVCLAPVAVSQARSVKMPETVEFTHPVLMEGRVSSHYGNRKHPVTKMKKMHLGIDLAVAEGTPIYAPIDGLVLHSGVSDGYGENLKIALSDGRKLRFAQMLDRSVEEGDQVFAGDQIGRVGQSGAATGPHLHLEIWQPVLEENGDQMYESIDPASVEGLELIKGVQVQIKAPKVIQPSGTPKAPKTPKTPMVPKPIKMEAIDVTNFEPDCETGKASPVEHKLWNEAERVENMEGSNKG